MTLTPLSRFSSYVPIRESLRLIGRRNSKVLLLVSSIQFMLSGLDLVGVLLLGSVAAIALSGLGGYSSSGPIAGLLELLGQGDSPIARVALLLAALAAGVLLVKSTLSVLLVRATLRYLARQQVKVSQRLILGLLNQSLVRIQRRSSQELTFALTQGVSAATTGLLGNTTVALNELGLMIVMSIALFWIDPVVTLTAFVYFSILAGLLGRILGRKLHALGDAQAAFEIRSFNAIQEVIHSFREIVVTNRRDLYSGSILELRQASAALGADAQFMSQVPKYVMEFSMVVGGGILAAILFLTRMPADAVGILVLFIAASSRIVPAMMRLQASLLAIRLCSGVARPTYQLAKELGEADLIDVNRIESRRIADAMVSGHEGFRADLQIERVWLTYVDTPRPAIQDCSLRVEAGQSVAIVGPSGAGKSTLADLILGILKPDFGQVRLSGVSPEEAIRAWPGAIGYVPQEVTLSNSTIRHNVAFGLLDEDIDDERVWHVLQLASLIGVVGEYEHGLDTQVGEKGARMSGGQRQRLGLARALYSAPRLLVLDEATSALDAETEASISAALSGLHGKVTIVTVAHRLATVKGADAVVYLDAGKILAQGSFDEVRRTIPAFERQARLLGIND